MRWRLIYALVTGLVLAGIVHIAIVLLVPQYGTRGAWAFLSGRTDPYVFSRLEAGDSARQLANSDPFFSYGVCRFDLTENGLRMQGPQTANFWSASIFDDKGNVVYSLNNRTAIDETLDILILSPLQGLELREAALEDIENSVIIEASVDVGYAIVRVFKPDASWQAEIDQFFDGVACSRFQIR